MKIFVVGGAGYIGSICVELLLDEGHEVIVFDNLTEGHRRAVDERAAFIGGDLSRREEIGRALLETKPEAVMHFAANALVGESMQNPSKYFRNNVCAGINLLDTMLEADVRRFVFSSTCATFGPPERVPIDETLPQRPINPYGESKLMFEKILRWYDEIHGLKVRLPPLLQRRRGDGKIRRGSSLRDAPHPERAQGRARPKTAGRDLRNRLRNARRHLHPRLHPHP